MSGGWGNGRVGGGGGVGVFGGGGGCGGTRGAGEGGLTCIGGAEGEGWTWSGRRSESEGGGSAGNSGGRLAFDGETAGGFPAQTNEDLDFIFAGQPTPGLRIPIRITNATSAAIPWAGFVIDQVVAIEPQGGPLSTGGHLIVRELRIDMADRILEDGSGIDRLIIFIQGVRKLQWAEDRSRIGRCGTAEEILNHKGHVRGGGDSGCIGDRRRGGNGGREGDSGSEGDGGSEGERGSEGGGDGGRKVMVGDRFSESVGNQSHSSKDNRQEQHAPTGDHAVAAHAEELEGARLTN